VEKNYKKYSLFLPGISSSTKSKEERSKKKLSTCTNLTMGKLENMKMKIYLMTFCAFWVTSGWIKAKSKLKKLLDDTI
jgi:hypothetical protein